MIWADVGKLAVESGRRRFQKLRTRQARGRGPESSWNV